MKKSLMTVSELTQHFETSKSSIKRWLREFGVTSDDAKWVDQWHPRVDVYDSIKLKKHLKLGVYKR